MTLGGLGVALGTLTLLGLTVASLWPGPPPFQRERAERGLAEFVAYAGSLPGASVTEARLGPADTFLPNEDAAANVELDPPCSLASVRETAEVLRSWITEPARSLRVHPVVSCGDDRLGVSPVAAVTEERMALLTAALEHPDVASASVTYGQRGDDPHHDDTNEGVRVAVSIEESRSIATVANSLVPVVRAHTSTAFLAVDGSDPGAERGRETPAGTVPGVKRLATIVAPTTTLDVIEAVAVLEQLEEVQGFVAMGTDPRSTLIEVVTDAQAAVSGALPADLARDEVEILYVTRRALAR